LEVQKWKARLELEIARGDTFAKMDDDALAALVARSQITSSNFDTVAALDFPHYCVGATEGCGGAKGWCYTFQGRLASSAHHKKVALTDVASMRIPEKLALKVCAEVHELVRVGSLPYPNLRYSGSGEVALHHVDFLGQLASLGVHLWGFSRNLAVARALRARGASVLVSCDRTSSRAFVRKAVTSGFRLAYTSIAVDDIAPPNTLVIFPLHRSGKVREVVNAGELCPKVVEEFFNGERRAGSCQVRCTRCHRSTNEYDAELC
jgi:hypothetical protein